MVMCWCPLKKTAMRVQNAGVLDGNININIKSLRLSDIPLTRKIIKVIRDSLNSNPLIISSDALERPPPTFQSGGLESEN